MLFFYLYGNISILYNFTHTHFWHVATIFIPGLHTYQFRLLYFWYNLDPPKIVNLLTEYKVAAHQSVSLQCKAYGNPRLSFTWTPCDPQKYVCDKSKLNAFEVQRDAVFTCKVTNDLGTDSANTSIGKWHLTFEALQYRPQWDWSLYSERCWKEGARGSKIDVHYSGCLSRTVTLMLKITLHR